MQNSFKMTLPFDSNLLPNNVPVMNLSHATLFPQAIVPLYIYEDCYRTMLEDVLSSHRFFALADLNIKNNSQMNKTGANNIKHIIAGLGMIRACRKNPDGTSHLILQGVSRIRIIDLSLKKPYPLAKITSIIPENLAEQPSYQAIKKTLIDFIENLVQLNPKLPEDILPFLANLDDSENVLDVAIASLCPSGLLKQSLLETLSVHKRYDYFLRFLEKEKNKILLKKYYPNNLNDLDDV